MLIEAALVTSCGIFVDLDNLKKISIGLSIHDKRPIPNYGIIYEMFALWKYRYQLCWAEHALTSKETIIIENAKQIFHETFSNDFLNRMENGLRSNIDKNSIDNTKMINLNAKQGKAPSESVTSTHEL